MTNTKLGTYAASLRESFPNYDAWKAEDFAKLHEHELGSMLVRIALKQKDYTGIIPQGYKDSYGDNAAYEFTRTILNEARRRGKPELFSAGLLDAGIRDTLKVSGDTPLNSDTPIEISVMAPDQDVPAKATAAQIVSHENTQVLTQIFKVKQMAIQRRTSYTPIYDAQVVIPTEASEAMLAANPELAGVLQPNFTFQYPLHDEAAYIAGYENAAGGSKSIDKPVNVEYPPDARCFGQSKAPDIFNEAVANMDVGDAWLMGKMQADIDKMTPAQRKEALTVCPPLATPNTSIANGNNTSSVNQQGGGAGPVAAPNAKTR